MAFHKIDHGLESLFRGVSLPLFHFFLLKLQKNNLISNNLTINRVKILLLLALLS